MTRFKELKQFKIKKFRKQELRIQVKKSIYSCSMRKGNDHQVMPRIQIKYLKKSILLNLKVLKICMSLKSLIGLSFRICEGPA